MKKFGLRRLIGLIVLLWSVRGMWYACRNSDFYYRVLEQGIISALDKIVPMIPFIVAFIFGSFLVLIKDEVIEKFGKVLAYIGFFGILAVFVSGLLNLLSLKWVGIVLGSFLISYALGGFLGKAWKWDRFLKI